MNLHTNPQDDVSIGVRHFPMAVPVIGTAAWYYKQLIKYPPQFKIGFISNNPPFYDVIPKAKETLEKLEMGKRPTPQEAAEERSVGHRHGRSPRRHATV